MPEGPETRDSLLLRLSESDAGAWQEFVESYRPMLERLAWRWGLQSHDADELVQQVLLNVSRAMRGWTREVDRGGFRAWLRVVARNAMLNLVQRRPQDVSQGGSEFLRVCEQLPTADDDTERMIDEEFARAELRAAARQVQQRVTPRVWQAFWLTTINEQSPQEAAARLDMSVGQVYGARSRVMKLLKDTAAEWSGRNIGSRVNTSRESNS